MCRNEIERWINANERLDAMQEWENEKERAESDDLIFWIQFIVPVCVCLHAFIFDFDFRMS